MNERTECLTRQEIDDYLANARHPSGEAQAANAHLAHCERCCQALRDAVPNAAERFERLFLPVEAIPACPEEELIFRYVEAETTTFETEAVERHLEDCLFCRKEIQHLRTLRQEMQAEYQSIPAGFTAESQHAPNTLVNTAPESSPTTETSAAKLIPSPSWWQRLRTQLSQASAKPLIPLTAGAMLACIVMYAALVMPRVARTDALARQTEAQRGLIQKIESEKADVISQAKEDTKQKQEEIERTRRDFERVQQQLIDSQQRQKQALFAGATLLSSPASGEKLIRDSQGGILRVQSLPDFVNQYLTHPQLAAAAGQEQRKGLAPPPVQLMGPEHAPQTALVALFPVACIVESPKPTFRWQSVTGVKHYRVRVWDETGEPAIRDSDLLTDTHWTSPDSLTPDHVYTWSVSTPDDTQEGMSSSDTVRFKVLGTQPAEELQRFANDPLTQGALYAKEGMPTQAINAFERFLQTNQHSPLAPQVQALIRTLKPLRH